jgi:signal transduction histidine kinase
VPHRVLHALIAAAVAKARATLGLLQLEHQLPEDDGRADGPDPVLAGPLSSRGARRAALLQAMAALPQQPGSRRRTVRFSPLPPALEELLAGKAGPAPVWVELDLELASEPAGRMVLVLGEAPGRARVEGLARLGRDLSSQLEQEFVRREALAEVGRQRTLQGQMLAASERLRQEPDPERIPTVLAAELRALGCHCALAIQEPRASPSAPGPLTLTLLSQRASAVARALRALGLRKPGDEQFHEERARSALLASLLASTEPLVEEEPGAMLRALFGKRATPKARAAVLAALGIERVLVAPLRAAGEPLGLLLLLPEPRTTPDLAALARLASEGAWALERVRLREQLYRAAVHTEQEAAARTRDLREEVDRLRQQDEAKDNFLANVSHELRSPLVTMLGYTDILLGERLGALNDKQRQCLQVAKSSGKRLKQFIEELMDFSRFELTRTALRREEFSVYELIQHAAEGLTPRLLERRIAVRVQIPRDLHASGDRERLLQVLVNLLANAERHCRDGGRIRIAATPAARGMISVAVQDTGVGIAPEHLSRIFDRLFQVGDAKGTSREGLGLGLHIVKSIVEMHGGTVTVESVPGRGSTFTFTLPAA